MQSPAQPRLVALSASLASVCSCFQARLGWGLHKLLCEILHLSPWGSPHGRPAACGGDGALAAVELGELRAGSFRLPWRKWEALHPKPDLCWVSRTDLAPGGPPSHILAEAPTAGHAIYTLGLMGRGAAQPLKGHTVIYNIPHWFHLWGKTGEDET